MTKGTACMYNDLKLERRAWHGNILATHATYSYTYQSAIGVP
jgi:hypothetical protein